MGSDRKILKLLTPEDLSSAGLARSKERVSLTADSSSQRYHKMGGRSPVPQHKPQKALSPLQFLIKHHQCNVLSSPNALLHWGVRRRTCRIDLRNTSRRTTLVEFTPRATGTSKGKQSMPGRLNPARLPAGVLLAIRGYSSAI